MSRNGSDSSVSLRKEYELHWNALFNETKTKETLDDDPPPYPFNGVIKGSGKAKKKRWVRNIGLLIVGCLLVIFGIYRFRLGRPLRNPDVIGSQRLLPPKTPSGSGSSEGGSGGGGSGSSGLGSSGLGSSGGSGGGSGGGSSGGGGGSSSPVSAGGCSGGCYTGKTYRMGGEKKPEAKLSQESETESPHSLQESGTESSHSPQEFETESSHSSQESETESSHAPHSSHSSHSSQESETESSHSPPQTLQVIFNLITHKVDRRTSKPSIPTLHPTLHSTLHPPPKPTDCEALHPLWSNSPVLPGISKDAPFVKCQVSKGYRVPDTVDPQTITIFDDAKPKVTISYYQALAQAENLDRNLISVVSSDGNPVVHVNMELERMSYTESGKFTRLGSQQSTVWMMKQPYSLTRKQGNILKSCVELQLGSVLALPKDSNYGWTFKKEWNDQEKGLFLEFIKRKCYLFHDLQNSSAKSIFEASFLEPLRAIDLNNIGDEYERIDYLSRKRGCNGRGTLYDDDKCLCDFGFAGNQCESAVKIVSLPSRPTISQFSLEDDHHNPFIPSILTHWSYYSFGSCPTATDTEVLFDIKSQEFLMMRPHIRPVFYFMGKVVMLKSIQDLYKLSCEQEDIICYSLRGRRVARVARSRGRVIRITCTDGTILPLPMQTTTSSYDIKGPVKNIPLSPHSALIFHHGDNHLTLLSVEG